MPPQKIALITGITGQDGNYLCRLLLEKGYLVHGLKRRSSVSNTTRIDDLLKDKKYQDQLFLHDGDVSDAASMICLVKDIVPDEIYNLAAQSHVKTSFENPTYTAQTDALGALSFLEAIRVLELSGKTRFYQASTSELYGKVQEVPQSETTPFYPRSPYSVAKLYAYWITVNYRESYHIHASNGILFNHESPMRGEEFVTRKITLAVANIHHKKQEFLSIGNLDAKRDWGHANEYVEGMWRIIHHDTPDDYVLATGETHSVREFVELSFAHIGIELDWSGSDENEIGKDKKTGTILVKVNPKYFRPAEVDLLVGDASKAEKVLGWKYSTSFKSLVTEMVQSDIELMAKN